MVPVALALLGTGARPPTVAFVGWFGPRGLASIVFAVLILQGEPIPNLDLILATISLTVILSVYAHGVSALPLTERYVAWVRGNRRRQQRRPVGWTSDRAGAVGRAGPTPGRLERRNHPVWVMANSGDGG